MTRLPPNCQWLSSPRGFPGLAPAPQLTNISSFLPIFLGRDQVAKGPPNWALTPRHSILVWSSSHHLTISRAGIRVRTTRRSLQVP